jgi:Tol biopolymer transport system component
MTLTVGSRIGAYEITGVLGAGGMGEVYRARDARLRRDVAIKVLPQRVAGDPERLARFEREAQILAALNHPHIAQIYGIEESGGVRALVMELVEGENLGQRTARAPLAIREITAIAQQIAEALENAHARGIVHRDLKPANIQLTPGGVVKVLDFGLAKAVEPDGPPHASGAPTLTETLVTGPRVIMGTRAYMSPEQATGAAVDKRTDVWAFGCVLYEMLARMPAMAGTDLFDARNPDLAALPAATPEAIRRLLRRCLQKDPKHRLHDIADARLELQDVATASEGHAAMAGPAARTRLERVAWPVAGVLFVGLIAALVWGRAQSARPASADYLAYRTALVLPPAANPGGQTSGRFALSPDGRRLAFVAAGDDGRRQLWLRSLDDISAKPMPGTVDATTPFWSSDSRQLAFFAHDKLKTIDVAGGPPVTLTEAKGALGGSWGHGGVIVFGLARSGLHTVPASGGTPTAVTSLDSSRGEVHHVWPFVLPDGRRFLYHAAGSKTGDPFEANGIYAGTLGSPERKLLVDGGSAAQYAGGFLLFMRRETLMAQRFDADQLTLTGDPVPVAEGIATNPNFRVGAFSASANGVLAYQTAAAQPPSRLLWFDRKGTPLGALGDAAYYRHPELSPDGSQVAVAILNPTTGARNLWIVDVARGVPTRLTSGDNERFPVWSPDGSRVAFTSGRDGTFDILAKASNGTGEEAVLVHDTVNKYPTSWSRDGKHLLYYTGGTTLSTGNDLLVLPLFGSRAPFPYLRTPFAETEGRFSPDGRWVAFQSSESDQLEVYVASFPQPGTKWRVSTNGGLMPRWSHDGGEILYLAPDNTLMSVAVTPATTGLTLAAARPLFVTRPAHPSWALAKDGRFLINTSADDTAPAPLTLFINWTAGLAGRKLQ